MGFTDGFCVPYSQMTGLALILLVVILDQNVGFSTNILIQYNLFVMVRFGFKEEYEKRMKVTLVYIDF